jgi:hypothetical protein
MVEYGDVEQFTGAADFPGHIHIGLAGLEVAGRVVVRDDDATGKGFERSGKDDFDIDDRAGCTAPGSAEETRDLVGAVEKKDEEFFEQFDVVAPIRAQDVFRIAGGMDAGAICGLQLAAVGNGDFGYLPEPCVFHKLDFYDLKMPPLRGRAGEPRPHLDLLPVGALVGEDFLPFCVGKRPQEPWRHPQGGGGYFLAGTSGRQSQKMGGATCDPCRRHGAGL